MRWVLALALVTGCDVKFDQSTACAKMCERADGRVERYNPATGDCTCTYTHGTPLYRDDRTAHRR
jgi:hypothetical protein